MIFNKVNSMHMVLRIAAEKSRNFDRASKRDIPGKSIKLFQTTACDKQRTNSLANHLTDEDEIGTADGFQKRFEKRCLALREEGIEKGKIMNLTILETGLIAESLDLSQF